MKRGQKRSEKTGAELAVTAAHAALERQQHSTAAGLRLLLGTGRRPPASLLPQRFKPEASLPGKSTLLEEEAGEASRHRFGNNESINLLFVPFCKLCCRAGGSPRAALSSAVGP